MYIGFLESLVLTLLGRNKPLSTDSDESSGVGGAGEWMTIFLIILSLKFVLLVFDPNLRVFMGDSASYLHAALTEWNPPDRSITYPWLVSIAAQAKSALYLVLIQTALGVGSCLLSYWILRYGGSVPRRWSVLTVSLIALEPAQLFYERMIMAEAAGFFMFMVMVASAVAYVARGKVGLAAVDRVVRVGCCFASHELVARDSWSDFCLASLKVFNWRRSQ